MNNDKEKRRYIDIYEKHNGTHTINGNLKAVHIKNPNISMIEQNMNVKRRNDEGQIVGDKSSLWAALAYLGLEIVQVRDKDKDKGIGLYIRSKEWKFLKYSELNKLGVVSQLSI